MKTKNTTLLLLLICLLNIGNIQSQTIIGSLAELKDRLDDDNGNFKMTPGTYYFDTTNCGTGKLFPDADILFFTGSNSTFDFTDVKFEFDSEIFAESYSSWSVQFWPVGDNNIYLNLTMEITGNETPNAGGEAIHLDGADNRIEGFHITQRSSYPYGYGDIFGKGGGSVIGHRKRAGILVRGDRNHIKDCTVLMRSYGHGIFMQGAEDALIEDCYVEGELRTVGEVLEETGTGSPADNVDFLTVWGYYLTELTNDYTFSLQEDGIRAYTNGIPYGGSERSTTGTQVKNCTVVQMRSGVTIGWDYTNKVVENCTVLACETGYWFGSNTTATGCSGDASVGPLISEDVGRSNSTIDLTFLDNYVPKIGNAPHFYFSGNGHDLTLHDGTTSFDSDIELQVGGERVGHRWLAGSGEEPINRAGSGLTFTNNTLYPVVVESNVSSSTINSCGTVTDNGSGNTITTLSSCNYVRSCDNTPVNLQAECYDSMSGIGTRNIVGNTNNEREVFGIDASDWIRFNGIDLTNMLSLEVTASSINDGVGLEVRSGSVSGTLLATLSITNTSDLTVYEEFSVDLNQQVLGEVDLYVVFTGSALGWLFNLDKLKFIEDSCSAASYNPVLPISAEDFCEASGVSVENLSIFNDVVSDIEDADYIKFSNVDFGYDDVYNSIDVLASSATTGGTVEVRSGSVNGTLLASVDIENTGDWDTYYNFTSYTTTEITGTHDLYFVFTGTAGSLLKVDNFSFYYSSDANNLALTSNGGIASQSSTDYEGVASRANDGNTSGNYGDNSVSHTEHGTNGSNTLKWWQVDLGDDKTINEIVIYNRTGGSWTENLNNYTVEIINNNGGVTFSQTFVDYPNPSQTIIINDIIGKIVKISKTSDRGLQLAEVEVYGTNVLNIKDFSFRQIKLYPNPATNEIIISNAAGSTIEIYNISGALEVKFPVIKDTKRTISIENLKSGVHFLKFTNNEGTTVKKLIKI